MNLSDKGIRLYKEYQDSLNAWIKYIQPIATQEYTDYLSKSGKIFNKHEHYCYVQYESETKDQSGDTEIKKIYKKLALLFHSDKFKKTDKIFLNIRKLYTDNDLETLMSIDAVSQRLIMTFL
jgi:hypothetical protein